jgi:outer membrane protein OmpA-like peptidoglycan-associated protein
MKHLNKLVVVICLFVGLGSQAQDNNNPWSLSFGANAVDTRISAASSIKDQFSQYFNTKDNWNIHPSVSYLNVSKFVGDNFSVGLTGSMNKISKFVNPRVGTGSYLVTNPGDLAYYAIDTNIKYSFMSLLGSKVIEPSAHIGGGYTFIDKVSSGNLNAGLGLTFWMSEQVGVSLQSTYKHSFDNSRIVGSDIPSHMQHFAGLIYKFGGKDTDGDGIYDKEDACPEVAGLKAFKGCPDTDGDGIVDASDACPDAAGSVAMNGCPDTDGDGVADKDDSCPEVAGLKALKGCPDTDGDGTTDKADKCPTVNGPKENAGCPWPDTDGDSVLDKDDKCPAEKGSVANNGCPEVTVQTLEDVNLQAKSIYFNSGKATFKTSDVPVRLDAIAAILVQYPNAKFSVEGHTDSDGSEMYNQKLSEARANAVRDAIIKRGISASNVVAIGFGETAPIASNKKAEGKAQNRRTEVKLQK